MKIAVIQGPNINMLGVREQNIYGPMSMDQIHKNMQGYAESNKLEIEFSQSNLEGEIVDRIQECLGEVDGIIINAAAYTHSSIAIRDAISAVGLPVVEVHLTNTSAREEFRHKSMIAPVCAGVISGFGPFSYHLALMAMHQILTEISAMKEQQAE
ncbi:MAG: type II 3-dehydroquinate dehydratase [Campylobacterales bacterium]